MPPRDTTPKQKLSPDQKAEVRDQMDAYKAEHPEADLKDILSHIDVPYKELVTPPVLRGLAARRPGSSIGGRRKGVAGRPRRKTVGGRARGIEKALAQLSDLHSRRDKLDAEIEALESDVRSRMNKQLGTAHAGRVFNSLLKGVGEKLGDVGGKLGDAGSAVGGKIGEAANNITGGKG
ncbi:MAG: hypothetical protein ACR2M0_10295 [Chloroflexia bacterium]